MTHAAPDLYPINDSVTENSVVAGGSTIVILDAGNQGNAASNDGEVHFYWKNGSASYLAGDKVGDRDYSSVPVGGSEHIVFSFEVPANTPAGNYYLSLEVNATGSTDEGTSYANNKKAFLIQVTAAPALPDLTWQNPRLPYPSLYQGENYQFFVTPKNVGGTTAQVGRIRYYLNESNASYTNGYQGQDLFISLDPGESGIEESTPTLQISQTAQPNTYYFSWFIDADNTTDPEGNDFNNRSFVAFTVLANTAPQHTATAITPSSGAVGTSFIVKPTFADAQSPSQSIVDVGVQWRKVGTSAWTTINNIPYINGTSPPQFETTITPSSHGTYEVRFRASDVRSSDTNGQRFLTSSWSSISTFTVQAPNTAPALLNYSITPSPNQIGTPFSISSTWNDADADHVVDVEYRYKIDNGSWSSAADLPFVSGTSPPQFTANFTPQTIGTYHFETRASDAETPTGTRLHTTAWQSMGSVSVGTNNPLGLNIANLDNKKVRGMLFFGGGINDNPTGYKRMILREGSTDLAYVHIGGLTTNLGLHNRRWRRMDGSPIYRWDQLLPDTAQHTLTMVGVLEDNSEISSAPFTVQIQTALTVTVDQPVGFPRYRNAANVNFTAYGSSSAGGVSYQWYHNSLKNPFDTDGNNTASRQIEEYGLHLVTVVVTDNDDNVTFSQIELPVARHTLRGYPAPTDRSYAGVNVRTGNYFSAYTDLFMPSVGVPFLLQRFYNSDDGTWSFSYTDKIVRNQTGNTGRLVTVQKADGRNCDYYHANNGRWIPLNPGNYETLEEAPNTGSFTLYTQGQLYHVFEGAPALERDSNTHRKITAVHDRHNNVTSVTWNADQTIANVRDSVGRLYNFDYVTVGSGKRLEKVTDPSGRFVQYSWNADGTLHYVTDVRNKSTSFAYHADAAKRLKWIDLPLHNIPLRLTYSGGKVSSLQDGNLKTTNFTYNHATASYTTVVNPPVAGNTLTFGFTVNGDPDSPGQLNASVTSVMNSNNEVVSTTYTTPADLAGHHDRLPNLAQPKSANNRSGHDTSYQFSSDRLGNLVSFSHPIDNTTNATSSMDWETPDTGLPNLQRLKQYHSPENRTMTYTFVPSGTDGYGKVQTATNDLGEQTQYTYFANGLVKTITDPRNHTHHYEYHPQFGLPTKITDPDNHYEAFTYDAWGFLASYRNKRGHITTFLNDKAGNRLRVTDPAPFTGQFATWTWDDNNRLHKHRDRRGYEWENEYDNANNLIKIIDPTSAELRFEYDDMNRIKKRYDQRNNPTTNNFDGLSRITTRVNVLSYNVAYEYDTRDNITKITDEEGRHIILEYDRLNRLTKVTDQLTHYVQYTYDKDGLVTHFRDQEGRVKEYKYDAAGRLEEVIGPENGEANKTLIERDNNGNVTKITDPNGHERQYEWDKLNRLFSLTDDGGRIWQWIRDEEGNVITEKKPSTLNITHTYDALNRRKLTTWS